MGDTCFRITATVDGEPVTELDAAVEICVEYAAEDLAVAEGDPALLTFGYYDEATDDWDILTTEINEAAGTICTTISHLSEEDIAPAGGLLWWHYLLIALAALVVILIIVVLLTQHQRQRKKPPSGQRPAEFEPEEMPEPL